MFLDACGSVVTIRPTIVIVTHRNPARPAATCSYIYFLLHLLNFFLFLLLRLSAPPRCGSLHPPYRASTEPCRARTDGAPTTPAATTCPNAALGTIPAEAGATPLNMILPAVGQPRTSKDGDHAAALANGRPLRESVPAGDPLLAKYVTAL